VEGLPAGIDPRLAARARGAAAWVRQQREAGRAVTVVHHIDADGVSAGAVAATALERAATPFRLLPVKSLDAHHVALIRDAAPEALWFCDLGSTAYMHFAATPRLVCDHHQLVRDGSEESFAHLNPLLDGLDGHEVSGAGCAYLAAAALDPRNVDLLPLALVGASADRQDRPALHGTNALLLRHAEALGLAACAPDLAFFGPETRPLRKFLSLAGEPALPGITGDARAAERLLLRAGVPLEAGGAERTWSRLDAGERAAVRSLLVHHLLDLGLAADVERLLRPVVTLPREPAGPTRELQEFGTLLNSTARYDRPDVGIAVARGDRGAAYAEALELLLDHRRHLVAALDAFARSGVQERPSLQWVHLRDAVRDTVVGIVAGMALGGALELRRDRPLVAFAWTPDGRTKVSSRAPGEARGRLDLSVAMREAAAAVGGQGGGHPGAAGATIPRGAEEAFLAAAERVLERQLGIPAPTVAAVPAAVGWTPRGQGAQTRLL
jgi:single-stranded-DNA-specific exonuclease